MSRRSRWSSARPARRTRLELRPTNAGHVNWADAHGVGYEAWQWDTWGNCLDLIADFTGTPNGAYGNWIRSHYLQFPPP